MKYFLSAVLLLITLMGQGQIVNIPDSNFKALLVQGYDLNGDGEIQESEALEVSEMFVPTSNTVDLTGIRAFRNLITLSCSYGMVNSLDLSGLVHLSYLDCSGNRIETINLSGCDSLKTFYCGGNRIRILILINKPVLEQVFCANNRLMINFELSGCTKLKYIDCQENSGLLDLDLSQCDSLEGINTSECRLQTLNISGLTKFYGLDWGGVKHINARNCTGLQTLRLTSHCNGICLESIDLTGCRNLKDFVLWDNRLISLDLSSCINLKTLDIWSVDPSFRYINIKNGSSLDFLSINQSGLPRSNPLYICADEFEIADSIGLLRVTVEPHFLSSTCSFFPGGVYNTISGKTQLSTSGTSCDSTSRGMPYVALRISDTAGNTYTRYTASSGNYAHYPYKGSFTIQPYFPYPYFAVNPSSSTINFDTANSLMANANFCIQPTGVHNDLEISFFPTWPPARPGFEAAYTLVYKNRGTTTLSGNVQVNFDNSRMNFLDASTTVTTQGTGQLNWNYNNLQPFESRTIGVSFTLLPPPVNSINDTLTFLAAITPSTNDETPFDNSFILPQRVIGSYDPNDKACLEGGKLDISKIGDYLHYQIRFQNEGTDTAFNVVVVDTLSNNLDWNSFEFIKASHGVDVRVTNNNVEFIFENIRLPHKAVNEPASNGWVAFKIKPKPSVVIGDSINNNAAIYFDFNFPIITNLVSTIVSNTGTPLPVKLEYFSISSRNNTNLLHWKATCTNGTAKFSIERSTDGIHFTSIGSITATALRCQLPLDFTDEQPAAGKNYYRLKITDADGLSHYSKTIVVGNSKAGLQVSAISNGIAYLNVAKQQTIRWQLIAADGRLINANTRLVNAGPNQILLNHSALAKGIYSLVIHTGNGEIVTSRFLR